MIKNIKIDGSGDAVDINTALYGFLLALDTGSVPDTEELTINLIDAGPYAVGYLSYYVTRLVQSKITIKAGASVWRQATIASTDAIWFEWNTPFTDSYLNLEIRGCGLDVAGTLLKNHDQDVLIRDCVSASTGFLALSDEGQITIDHLVGTPLNVTIEGDQTTAARGLHGAGRTHDRPALVVVWSRLGHVRTNKPVNITNSNNCRSNNLGLSSYTETSDYSGEEFFVNVLKIGSFFDNVAINFGGAIDPLMTIVDGGLYRRMVIGILPSDNVAPTYSAIVVKSPSCDGLHAVNIDRNIISRVPYGITIQGGGNVIVSNNTFKNIGLANVRRETCCGRLHMKGNRGGAIGMIGVGCNATDC